jgi:hypothetical protein
MKRDKNSKKPPKARNWIAIHAFQRSGGGSHTDKSKYSRKTKHKGSSDER